MTAFTAPIAQEIWEKKYRLVRANGEVVDNTVEDTWWRIAWALAGAEDAGSQDYWAKEFYNALTDFKFLPAGRITAGAGTGRRVTLSNCFTMGTIPDSMDGIFEHLKEAALTMQQGGGIGYDFSTIRPKGSLVAGVDADASGPLSFMDCWDSMCRTIMSAGARRGAMMATMRCDHPDIEDFITAKQDAARLRMFNLSVLVTDAFMDAVKNDEMWPLVHEKPPAQGGFGSVWRDGKELPIHNTVLARDLWDTIMRSTYDYAEPGVIFIDRVNRDHNINYLESVATTNPCGEKPMGPYASCLLGSINLARLVENPFEKNAGIDQHVLEKLVETAIRMMDNVVDVGGFPLPAQLEKAKQDRQLGLGVTGLADALAMCGIRYGSEEAAVRAENWMRIIDTAAYKASVSLAKEKGYFPTFDAEKFLADGTHASKMPAGLKNVIRKHGIRNALLTSIAPTGTISLYAGNVSSGVEPIFATGYNRRVLEKDGSESWQRVEDYAVTLYREKWQRGEFTNGDTPVMAFDPENDLPDYFVTAQTLAPEDHVRMQSAVQGWVDSSISKTVNLPANISFEDFKAVYLLAYDSGCKGCTTYRPNDVTGSVLNVDQPESTEGAPSEKSDIDAIEDAYEAGMIAGETVKPVAEAVAERPEQLYGSTYKLKWPGNPHAMYVTISDIVEDGQLRPFEIFINSKNMEHFAWTVALTRMISAVFRRPHDSKFVVEELKNVFDPRGGAWVGGKYVPSILAAIGQIIERHMIYIGYIETAEKFAAQPEQSVEIEVETPSYSVETCPSCGSTNYNPSGGCTTCGDCGYSACG